MSDIKYFLKLLGLTLTVVLLTQVHVGERTVEAHAMSWMQSSLLLSPMNSAAAGASKMVRDVTGKMHSAIERNKGKGKRKGEEKKSSSSFRWFKKSEPEPVQDIGQD